MQSRNQNKIKRKYKIGGMNLTQRTTNSNPNGWYNKSVHKWLNKTTLNNTTTDSPANPRVDTKPNCKKNAERMFRASKVGVWIVCQHRNDPRSNSSLKTLASNKRPFGPNQSDRSPRSMNKRQMTVHLRRLNNRDGWKQLWRHMNNYYRQHGASLHQTLSSNIWWDPHRWIRTFEEPNLKSRKSRIKINIMPRSRSNHHQLQLPVNKKQEKNTEKNNENSDNNKKLLGPPQNRRDDAGDQNLQQLQQPRTQMKIRRTTDATTGQNGARQEKHEPPPKEQARRWCGWQAGPSTTHC